MMMESVEENMTAAVVGQEAKQMGAVSPLPRYTKQQLAELQGQDPIFNKVMTVCRKGTMPVRTELQEMHACRCLSLVQQI